MIFISLRKIIFKSLKRAPNDDLRPESLQTCKDNIYLNVFDEVIVDALEVRFQLVFPYFYYTQLFYLP